MSSKSAAAGPAGCALCGLSSSLRCSGCSKVVYCNKEHQKLHRKVHKKLCFPADLKTDPELGSHLVATREIAAGEVIIAQEPLLVGPRSNLPEFRRVCLGCCEAIEASCESVCSSCQWPVCSDECSKKSWHAKFECQYLKVQRVPPARTDEEYLFVTVLRGLLLQEVDPPSWTELQRFESHSDKLQRIANARLVALKSWIEFACGPNKFKSSDIDFVYGVLLVNGYSHAAKCSVKLYQWGSKVSHSCLPNTRNVFTGAGAIDDKLRIVSILPIESGKPLTQLYGMISQGTRERQVILQSVYFFSCNCPRCEEPTELGTNFSSVRCRAKACHGIVTPNNPRELISAWKCSECSNKLSYEYGVLPVLAKIEQETGMAANDALFSEFEFYSYENPDVPLEGDEVVPMKLEHIWKIFEIIEHLSKTLVHPNHFSMLPVKTAVIATSHVIFQRIDSTNRVRLLAKVIQLTKEVLEVMNVLQPGLTRDRGILLLYLYLALKMSTETPTPGLLAELNNLWTQASTILALESEDDVFRQMFNKSCPNTSINNGLS